MRHDSDASGSAARALPQARDLAAAVGLLTALPAPRPDARSTAFARATLFFPVVGAGIGVLLLGLDWLLAPHLTNVVMAVLLVVLWEGLSAGTADLTGPGAWRRAAGLGTLALLKLLALATLHANRPAALLFAPLLARWSMVVLAVGARDAAAPGRKFNSAVTFREFALTSVLTFAVVLAVADAFGVLIVACTAAATVALRVLYHRRPGGVSWPLLVISAEVIEVIVLIVIGVAAGR